MKIEKNPGGIREIFRTMDSSGDGLITYKEFRQNLGLFQIGSFSDRVVNEFLGQIDVDRNGYVDYDEFVTRVPGLPDLDVIDINCRDSLGRTGLMLAAAGGHTAAVDFLLRRFADIDAVDNAQMQPIEPEVAPLLPSLDPAASEINVDDDLSACISALDFPDISVTVDNDHDA